MNIVEFFQLSSGKWFSHRTGHQLVSRQSDSGKSTLQIEFLDPVEAIVVDLCKQASLDPALAVGGLQTLWEVPDCAGKTITKLAILAAIADLTTPSAGTLLRKPDQPEAPPILSRYAIDDSDALTLTTATDLVYSEERLWFASPNLRLRTSLLKQADGYGTAYFYSEIRMGGAKPA